MWKSSLRKKNLLLIFCAMVFRARFFLTSSETRQNFLCSRSQKNDGGKKKENFCSCVLQKHSTAHTRSAHTFSWWYRKQYSSSNKCIEEEVCFGGETEGRREDAGEWGGNRVVERHVNISTERDRVHELAFFHNFQAIEA